jgi:uncharacterized protein YkwD
MPHTTPQRLILSTTGLLAGQRTRETTDSIPLSTGSKLDVFERTLLNLARAERARAGREPLEMDPELQRLARARAAQKRNEPLRQVDDVNRLEIGGVAIGAAGKYLWYAEILARVDGSDELAAARVHRALMSLSAHRQVILEPLFNCAGVGAVNDGKGSITVVTLVGEVR